MLNCRCHPMSDLPGFLHEEVMDQHRSRKGLFCWLDLSLLPGSQKSFFLSPFKLLLKFVCLKQSKIALLFWNRNYLNICGGITSAHGRRFSNLQPLSIESSLKMINPTFLQFPRCFASWFPRSSFARCRQMTGKGLTVSFEPLPFLYH